jgi:hypothetical protein
MSIDAPHHKIIIKISLTTVRLLYNHSISFIKLVFI